MLQIRPIRKQDYKNAIEFAILGMHFNWYVNNKVILEAYGKYFWYLELSRATEILAVYEEETFVGVLLAEIYGETRKHKNFFEKLYVKLIDIMQKIFLKDGPGVYEETVKMQLSHYLQSNTPDGEIIFLAVDPSSQAKGIGTFLLNALSEKAKGKTLYLHTDDACTYQFYEHRGFIKKEEDDVVLKMPKGEVPLKCLLYSKTF